MESKPPQSFGPEIENPLLPSSVAEELKARISPPQNPEGDGAVTDGVDTSEMRRPLNPSAKDLRRVSADMSEEMKKAEKRTGVPKKPSTSGLDTLVEKENEIKMRQEKPVLEPLEERGIEIDESSIRNPYGVSEADQKKIASEIAAEVSAEPTRPPVLPTPEIVESTPLPAPDAPMQDVPKPSSPSKPDYGPQELSIEILNAAWLNGKLPMIKIQKSSGEMENGWLIQGINPETGFIRVWKPGNKEKGEMDPIDDITIEELKNWNEDIESTIWEAAGSGEAKPEYPPDTGSIFTASQSAHVEPSPSAPEHLPGPEKKEWQPTPEEEAKFESAVENLPPNEKMGFWKGVTGLGFRVEAAKNNAFARAFGWFAGEQETASRDKTGNRFFTSLHEIFNRDAKRAEQNLTDLAAGKQAMLKIGGKEIVDVKTLQGAGFLSGNILKYGRLAGGALGITPGIALANFFAMAGGRGLEAAKEARFKNEDVIEKTRIQDVEAAADEAWAVYEAAEKKVGEGKDVTKETLEKAYIENIPKTLQDRLDKLAKDPKEGTAAAFWERGLRNHIAKIAEKHETQLKEINEDKSLSDAEKETKKEQYLNNWFMRSQALKDYDRMLSQEGEIDGLAALAKGGEMGAKAAVYGIMGDSIGRLGTRAYEVFSSSDGIVEAIGATKLWSSRSPETMNIAAGKLGRPLSLAEVQELAGKNGKEASEVIKEIKQKDASATPSSAPQTETPGVAEKNAPPLSGRFPSPHYIDYALGEPKLPGMQSGIGEQIEKLGNVATPEALVGEAGLPTLENLQEFVQEKLGREGNPVELKYLEEKLITNTPNARELFQITVEILRSAPKPFETQEEVTEAVWEKVKGTPLEREWGRTAPENIVGMKGQPGTQSGRTLGFDNEVPGKSGVESAAGIPGGVGTQSGIAAQIEKLGNVVIPEALVGEGGLTQPGVPTSPAVIEAISVKPGGNLTAVLKEGLLDKIGGSGLTDAQKENFVQNLLNAEKSFDPETSAQVKKILEANGISDPSQIKAGQSVPLDEIYKTIGGEKLKALVDHAQGLEAGTLEKNIEAGGEVPQEMGDGKSEAAATEGLSVTPKHTPYFDALFGTDDFGKDYPIETYATTWRDVYLELRASRKDIHRFGFDKFFENGFGKKVKEMPLETFLKKDFDQSILKNGGLSDDQISKLFGIAERMTEEQMKVMPDGKVLYDKNTKVGDLLMGTDQLLQKGAGLWADEIKAADEKLEKINAAAAQEATPASPEPQAPEVPEQQPKPAPAPQPEQPPVPESPRGMNEAMLHFDQDEIARIQYRWSRLAEHSPGGDIFRNPYMQRSLNEDIHLFLRDSNYKVQLFSRADAESRTALRELVSAFSKSHQALSVREGPARLGQEVSVREYLAYAGEFLRASQMGEEAPPPPPGLA